MQGEEGNLPVRWPVGGVKAGTPVKAYRITQVPTHGRKAYRGKELTCRATDEGPLVTELAGGDKKIFNLLEVDQEGAEFVFLIVDDEIEAWEQNGVIVCDEVPRGYI